MDDSKLLQESNLIARQPRGALHHVIQATASEGLAQGLYVAGRVGLASITLRTEGTELPLSHHAPHSAICQLGRRRLSR